VTLVFPAFGPVSAATPVAAVALAGAALAAVAMLALAALLPECRVARVGVVRRLAALAGRPSGDSLLAVASALTPGARRTGVVALLPASLATLAASTSGLLRPVLLSLASGLVRFVDCCRPIASPPVGVAVAGPVVFRLYLVFLVVTARCLVALVAVSGATLSVAVGGVPVLVRVALVRGVAAPFVSSSAAFAPRLVVALAVSASILVVAPSVASVSISHTLNPQRGLRENVLRRAGGSAVR
jgi:hypothetical protein